MYYDVNGPLEYIGHPDMTSNTSYSPNRPELGIASQAVKNRMMAYIGRITNSESVIKLSLEGK
jgi:hypothetical protein